MTGSSDPVGLGPSSEGPILSQEAAGTSTRHPAKSRFRSVLAIRLGAASLAAAASGANGQDLEPRTYANTPVGLNFLIVGYSYLWGGVTVDPTIPLEDAKLQAHGAVFAYARSLDVFGQSGKFDVILPTAWLSGTASFAGQPRERDISGFADPRFRFSVNLYGAPALTLAEFANYEQDVIVGASVQVSAPGGQYDPEKLVNLGTNHWSVKTELGVSKRWGPVTLELAGEGTFYTDNTEFFPGHQTRSQDPIYAVQGHLIYSFGANIWGSLDGTYYAGGSTSIDGGPHRNLQENTRIGATLALPISRNHSVKLYGSTGVSTRTGSNFDLVGIAWQYRFGGGL
ncbi:transporter [Methylocaldum sp.]|uniref:transporter n=1 Tax=Methylocaldum sp. TaxID=1969727 RepID=UPI002D296677|nr:transporter [Methylocaldum sp.]HYE34511.1 transporter [Methylocaldum sp.]